MCVPDDDREPAARTITATTASPSERAPAPADASSSLPLVDPSAYELLGEFARGGIGRIIKARDRRLDREVALKQLHDPGADRGRFAREALLTARLQHPAIVPVYEVGQFPSGEPFIAMKLVRGQSLRDAIDERPTLAQRLDLLPNVIAVVDAMAYAHSERVIHRDLKPRNVLLGAFGETVVIDWGLAKELDAAEAPRPADGAWRAPTPEMTEAGAVLGTPVYMAPEQALGEPADERADVYALGALLYHLVSGAAPFSGDSGREVRHKVLTSEPIALAERAPEAPPELVAIIGKAMARRPSDRYPDARALAADLHRFMRGQRVSARPADDDHDPVVEAAFARELRTTTNLALRLLAPIGVIVLAAYAVVPWLYHGRFDPLDLWPRAVTVLALGVLSVLARHPASPRWSQDLGVALVFLVGAFIVVVNVLERNAIGWFTESMLTAMLACSAMLPLTPRRMLVAVGACSVGACLEGLLTHMRLLGVPFVLQASLVSASALIAFLGARMSFRLRRAEFYNRYRLQAANERLARFDSAALVARAAPRPPARGGG